MVQRSILTICMYIVQMWEYTHPCMHCAYTYKKQCYALYRHAACNSTCTYKAVYIHQCTVTYELSKAQELFLAHTKTLDQVNVWRQMYGEHLTVVELYIPKAIRQGRAADLAHDFPVTATRCPLQGWKAQVLHFSDQRGFSYAGGERSCPDCHHWHSRMGLFRWVLSGSSKICKKLLVSSQSPAESRSSQWTGKASQWY